jgi:hypothetical protein
MRITGRTLRASNLAERRVLKALGTDALRVPRKLNPFAVARHIRKIAAGAGGDLSALRAALKRLTPHGVELPDSTSSPRDAEKAA